MAYEKQENVDTYIAGAAIAQYTMVKLDSTAGQVINSVDDASPIIGVALQAATAAGDRIAVQQGGVAKVKAGAAIALNAVVTSIAAGKADDAFQAGTGVRYYFGIALRAATADGDIIPVLVRPGERYKAA